MFMDMWSTAIAVLASGMFICDSHYGYHTHLSYFAAAYFMVDIKTCNLSHKLHHVCTLWLLYWVTNHPQLMFLCKMEMSTLILNVIPYVNYKTPLKALFLLMFVKTRVYDYYYFLSELDTLPIFFGFFILYTVNLYWFSLMIKKMWGDRTRGSYYVTLCHQINRFSYLGTLPFMSCLPMTIVHGFISITSFFYHYSSIYNHNMGWFILDSIAIHAVLLLNVISVQSPFLFLSLWVNLFTLIHRIVIVDFNNIQPALFMSYYPVLLDSMIILCSEIPFQVKIDYALQLYLMGISLYMECFNDLSYIGFHIVCWFNAHTMSKLICI
jgi:hypothetical protein